MVERNWINCLLWREGGEEKKESLGESIIINKTKLICQLLKLQTTRQTKISVLNPTPKLTIDQNKHIKWQSSLSFNSSSSFYLITSCEKSIPFSLLASPTACRDNETWTNQLGLIALNAIFLMVLWVEMEMEMEMGMWNFFIWGRNKIKFHIMEILWKTLQLENGVFF